MNRDKRRSFPKFNVRRAKVRNRQRKKKMVLSLFSLSLFLHAAAAPSPLLLLLLFLLQTPSLPLPGSGGPHRCSSADHHEVRIVNEVPLLISSPRARARSTTAAARARAAASQRGAVAPFFLVSEFDPGESETTL